MFWPFTMTIFRLRVKTLARSRAHLTSYLSTVYSQHKYSCLVSVFNLNLKMVIVKGQNM